MRPRARRSGLVVRDLANEVVVYDLGTHEAHCLNRTAAIVFHSADGERTLSALAALLAPECGPELSRAVLGTALETLSTAGLLESPLPEGVRGTSRREALRRVGLGAAVLLPVVTSLVVPTPAEAANTCIPVEACTGNTLQPCYNSNSEAECPTLKCRGPSICG